MKTRIHVATVAACMFMSAAQAEVVQLDFDVQARAHNLTTDSRWFGEALTDQHFDVRVSIDLDGVIAQPSDTSASVVGVGWYFLGAQLTSSPFSSALMSSLPADAPSGGWTMLDTSMSNVGGDVVVDAVDTNFSVGFNKHVSTAENQQTTSSDYTQRITMDPVIGAVSFNGLQGWTNADLQVYWRAQIGQTFLGGYSESFQKVRYAGMWVNDKWIGSGEVLGSEQESYTGDVTLRSVTMVPEPATYVLMGLGLPLFAAVRRRSKGA